MSAEVSLDSIFAAALEIASAEERAAYLVRACDGDEAVRRRVEQLLEEMKSQWITPDTMRGLWLIELLEQQATPEASALLTLLAKGPRGAWVTEEAGASLKRLEAGQK